MKKRLILVGVIAFLVLFSVAAPALGEAQTKTPFKALQINNPATTPEKTWTTNGDIRQVRDQLNTGTIQLYIPDTASSPQYVLRHNNMLHATRNLDRTSGDAGFWIIHVDVQWIYEVNGVILGTFEGQINYNVPQAHGILHGTGVFEGQTLMFSASSLTPQIIWVGTLLS
jgi:hypothetical protein